MRLIVAGLALLLAGVAPSDAQTSTQATRRTHALSLIGEPALPADYTHFPWANPNAPKGGTVVQGAIGSYDSFNPFIIRGSPAAGVAQIWETLLRGNPDEASTEYGHLAEVIELPDDGTWVAFELRANARWHDGRPITSEDVKWSFETLRDKGRPFYRAYYGDVVEVRTPTPRRVEFRFKDGSNRELPQILGQLPVLPKHWWEGRDFSAPLTEPPLGSGSYRVDSFELGRNITLRRVEDYWGRDVPTEKGTDNFDVIRYEYFRDTTVAFEAFKAGRTDFRQVNSALEWATGYDFPAFNRGLVLKQEIPHELPSGMQGFVFNTRRAQFQDARVREALGLLFDFEWSNVNLFYGAYTRTTSYFDNSDFASRGVPQGAELALLEPFRARLPAALFTTEFTVPKTDASGTNREGLRRAVALLREAGWTIRDRKLVNAQGQQMSFEILLNSPLFERITLPYRDALTRLGAEVRVRTVDPAQYQRRTDSFDYDMIVDVFGQSLSPGNEQRDFWSCAKAREQGSRNTIGVCDPVVDALIEKVIAAPDRATLIPAVQALDRVLLWGHYVVPHWHLRAFRVAYWDMFGRPERNPRFGFGFSAWWVDAQKAARVNAERR
jgi:microcin C transport system substrate-binding protein